MKKTLCFIFGLFACCSLASAFQIPPQPETCPVVAEIQATPFVMAKPFKDGTYGALQLNTYKTKDTWAFIVANISATSPKDAMEKASKALPSLSFNMGPLYFSQQNLWACLYNINSPYQAAAVTPLSSAIINEEVLFKAANLS